MKSFLPHMVIPLFIVFGGLFAYHFLVAAVVMLEVLPEDVDRLRSFLLDQPERAENCGVLHLLASQAELNDAVRHMVSALSNFLVGGTTGLAMLALAREMYIYQKYKRKL